MIQYYKKGYLNYKLDTENKTFYEVFSNPSQYRLMYNVYPQTYDSIIQMIQSGSFEETTSTDFDSKKQEVLTVLTTI